MQCIVINLDRSTDRLKEIAEEFERVDVRFIRLSAVDGRALSPEDMERLTPATSLWPHAITPSELGCYLSHRKCLEIIANGKEEYGAVFEDDVSFSPHIGRLLKDESWIPPSADLVKLETTSKTVLVGKLSEIADTHIRIGRLLSIHLCTGGYIISRSAAQKVLSLMEQVLVPIDNLIFDPNYDCFHSLKIYQVSPAVCIQRRRLGEHQESLIQLERRTQRTKRKGFAKLVKEVQRPFQKCARAMRGVFINVFTDQHWKPVKFDNKAR
ncbi:glycosyltransferase family 25 protein [Brucella oryzae]|uniref:Glycosyl transferase n=1 Tax=Brucella oryzae TaxID=335286 RepID=A0A2S7IYM7_9HYPH|nr:glycosyltransferase family 25 protein [Brucella oryzae]MBR7651417.1 glycosyltransferase family 25 protein [Brucella oryzae]PQA73046.1 glycosyl transferase [Brucella oryzae]